MNTTVRTRGKYKTISSLYSIGKYNFFAQLEYISVCDIIIETHLMFQMRFVAPTKSLPFTVFNSAETQNRLHLLPRIQCVLKSVYKMLHFNAATFEYLNWFIMWVLCYWDGITNQYALFYSLIDDFLLNCFNNATAIVLSIEIMVATTFRLQSIP